ncbi:D-alanine-D-alanine ligase [Arachidicoccus rhizosphaerae]|uniref:D-alanine--D-alanine ligase n=1 Tax=Arachidicoccus rhizosphaerae TaxID=551991 RepID=A0A1H4CM59_9BACT|nr:D-alanine--D-alanine ligase [Arachidicoccus rhizosphaerae]SEA61409.1 D-alanine-D-alanine ligase [Arachidicoccus rhizosphaerae]
MKKNIALVTGGFTGESVISYKSAENVRNNLDSALFNVYTIDITEKDWTYTDSAGVVSSIDRSDFSIRQSGQTIRFDKVFLCIHGSPGEDGRLPAYFELIGLPYTGCSSAVASLTMNKYHTVLIAGAQGIPTSKSYLALKGETPDMDKIRQLKFPVFIKPNDQGSSIAMSKVNEPDHAAILAALEKGFAVSSQVLIESYIPGREFTIGVMRDATGTVISLPMTEIILKKGREMFDFEAKYNGETAEITPAEATPEMTERVAEVGKKVYKALGCSGIVRIDFIWHATEHQPYLLEVNTIPGQTKESLVPKQVAAKGWTLKDFYTELLLAK